MIVTQLTLLVAREYDEYDYYTLVCAKCPYGVQLMVAQYLGCDDTQSPYCICNVTVVHRCASCN